MVPHPSMGSQHALDAQLLYLPVGHSEAAEDFGIVLADLGGDGAHPYAVADLDRAADMRDFAEFRVAGVLDEAAVAYLRVGEHLPVVIDRAARHAGGFEHRDPMPGGLCRQHRVHRVSSAARFAMRCWLVAKRGSSHHSGWRRASAQRAQIASPAAPTIR